MTVHIAKVAAQSISRVDSGGLVFNENTGGGNIYVDVVPPKPDVCVIITILNSEYETASEAELSRIADLQIRTRGRTLAEAWSTAARCSLALKNTSKSGWWGTSEARVEIRHCIVGMPVFMDVDNNDHPEYVFRVHVRYVDA